MEGGGGHLKAHTLTTRTHTFGPKAEFQSGSAQETESNSPPKEIRDGSLESNSDSKDVRIEK